MRKSLAVGLWLGLLGTAPLAKAQEESSKVELYGGYYYARFNVNANVLGISASHPRQHATEMAGVDSWSTTPTAGLVW